MTKKIEKDLQKLTEISDSFFDKFIKNNHNILYRDYLIDLFMIHVVSLFENIIKEIKK